jgi:hypothetical protein
VTPTLLRGRFPGENFGLCDYSGQLMKYTTPSPDRKRSEGVQLYAHLQMRLGLDMNEAEGVIADLEKNPSARIHLTDWRIRSEIQRLNVAAAP